MSDCCDSVRRWIPITGARRDHSRFANHGCRTQTGAPTQRLPDSQTPCLVVIFEIFDARSFLFKYRFKICSKGMRVDALGRRKSLLLSPSSPSFASPADVLRMLDPLRAK